MNNRSCDNIYCRKTSIDLISVNVFVYFSKQAQGFVTGTDYVIKCEQFHSNCMS